MATLDVGAQATTLTPPNPFPFALHTREGVRDLSGVAEEANKQIDLKLGAEAVQVGGKIVEDVYTGYHLADLENQITKEAINPFMAGRKMLSEEVALAKSHAALQEELKAKAALGEDVTNELKVAEAGHVAAMDKIKNAYKQGVMSQNEFDLKVRQLTREAANRNPGLTNQLIQHAQNVEHLAGVRLYPDLKQQVDNTQQKQLAATHKFVLSESSKRNIPVNPLKLNDPEYLNRQIALIEKQTEQEAGYEEFKVEQNKSTIVTKEQAQQFMDNHAYDIVKGAERDLINSVTFALDEGKPLDELRWRNEINTRVSDFISYLNKQPGVQEHPNYKFTVDTLRENLNGIHDLIAKEKDGTILKQKLQNQVAINSANEKLQVQGVVNVEALKTLGPLLQGNQALIQGLMNKVGDNKQSPMDVAMTQAASLLSLSQSPASHDFLVQKDFGNGKTNAATLLGEAIKLGETKGTNSLLKGVVAATIDNQKTLFPNITDKILAQGHIIKELGNAEYKGMIGEENQSIFNKLLDDHLTLAGQKMQAELTQRATGATINPTIKSDGRLYIEVSGRPGLEEELNAKYGATFNNAIKAWSNVHGENWKATSEILQNRYQDLWNFRGRTQGTIGTTGARGQNETNPLNIKKPGKNEFEKFASKEEGIKAVESQITKYVTGTSQFTKDQGGVQQPLIMDSDGNITGGWLTIYNNQKEKGSATDMQYAMNIASHSGLSLNELSQPLDVNDKETMADLLYGMAKAEGAKNITRRDVRKAL